MCIAIPGKIIEIKEDSALIDYGSKKRKVRIVYGDYNLGDFVIVQGGIVIEKVPKSHVKQWIRLVKNESKNES